MCFCFSQEVVNIHWIINYFIGSINKIITFCSAFKKSMDKMKPIDLDLLFIDANGYSSLKVVAGLATAALNIVPLVVAMPMMKMNSPHKTIVISPTSIWVA